jgi:hypothetical protein
MRPYALTLNRNPGGVRETQEFTVSTDGIA